MANGRLLDIIRRLRCFGLTLVRLDLRQESSRHTEVADAVYPLPPLLSHLLPHSLLLRFSLRSQDFYFFYNFKVSSKYMLYFVFRNLQATDAQKQGYLHVAYYNPNRKLHIKRLTQPFYVAT